MEAEVNIRGPVLAQMNVAIHLDVRLFELGLSGNSQLRSLGDRVNGELSRAVLVEGKVVEMNGGVKRRLFQCAGAACDEIRAAGYSDAAALQRDIRVRSKLSPVRLKPKA